MMGKTRGRLRRLPGVECLSPKTIREALSLIKKHHEKAKVIAGGTDLLPRMKHRQITPRYLIDLNGIPMLRFIKYEKEKGLRIGAGTTLNEILESPLVNRYCPILIKAVSQMASSQIRNTATIGGNLCNGAPSADTAPPLIALGARLKLVDLRKERRILVEDFFKGPEETVIDHSELVTEIQIPPSPPRKFGTYLKHTLRGAMDLAIVGVAVCMTFDSKKNVCRDIKIAMGAVAPTPMRAKKAEEVLKGEALDEDLIEHAARMASEESRPRLTSLRASPEYKREMVRVLTKRAIKQILGGLRSSRINPKRRFSAFFKGDVIGRILEGGSGLK